MNNKTSFMKISLKTKFTSASIVLALVLCAAIILISYSSYKSSMLKRYEDNITALVKTASALIPAQKVNEYMTTLKTDAEYELLIKQLRIIQKQNRLEYLYSYIPTPDGLRVFAQGTEPGDEGHFEIGALIGTDYYPEEDIISANLLFSNPDQQKIYITSGSSFGYLITAFDVIRDDAGNPVLVVGADMSMEMINKVLKDYLILVIIVALLIFVIFITIYIMFLRKTIINPLQLIVNSAIKFVDTNIDENSDEIVALVLDVKTGDEIEVLAEAFNKMTSDIIKYITELTNATSERERIKTELRVATLIQEGMLPHNFEFPGREEFAVYASMRAAKDVGGDFYDFFFVDEDNFCIVIGDVSGKGVPAALFMAMTKITVKDLVSKRLPVNDVMTEANESLCRNNEQGMFVTLFVAIVNVKTGKMEWCDAGHNPTILWKKDGSVVTLKGKKGFVCAGMEGIKYKLNEMTLDKGDIIYLYTDGITEAINSAGELYGESRLTNFIEATHDRDIKGLCGDILTNVDSYAGDEPQFDDITMLGFEYKGEFHGN